jgi:hypothetical protein
MQATLPGQNRTGAAVSPKEIELMLEAVDDLSPPLPISTLQMDVERQGYIADADSVGSIPPTLAPEKASSKKTASDVQTGRMPLLFDKLGERIAFERTGTRLYGALITKYLALNNAGAEVLPPAVASETALATLERIRAEELGHFHLLCDAVTRLGGDPTAQTPCADVSAAASIGLMQVITDPRTTLAQCLNTILTAELTDNAGWEMLAQLAAEAGQNEMAELFAEALEVEQQHLVAIRGWLQALLTNESGTPAV